MLGAYHQLWHIEKIFRISKHHLTRPPDLPPPGTNRSTPHLSLVIAALAVSHLIERTSGWTIKRFIRTARRYRTVDIRIGGHVLPAEEPLPTDLRDAPSP